MTHSHSQSAFASLSLERIRRRRRVASDTHTLTSFPLLTVSGAESRCCSMFQLLPFDLSAHTAVYGRPEKSAGSLVQILLTVSSHLIERQSQSGERKEWEDHLLPYLYLSFSPFSVCLVESNYRASGGREAKMQDASTNIQRQTRVSPETATERQLFSRSVGYKERMGRKMYKSCNRTT